MVLMLLGHVLKNVIIILYLKSAANNHFTQKINTISNSIKYEFWEKFEKFESNSIGPFEIYQ